MNILTMYICVLQVSDNDPLPHVICVRCAEQLDTLYGFRESARKAEHVLRQFLAYTQQLTGSPKVQTFVSSFIWLNTLYWLG